MLLALAFLTTGRGVTVVPCDLSVFVMKRKENIYCICFAGFWACLLAHCCSVYFFACEHVCTGSAFCFVVRLFGNSVHFIMDESDKPTIESVMIDFLDTVEFPGKDDELKKLTLGVLKENMLTARCFCYLPCSGMLDCVSLHVRTPSRC